MLWIFLETPSILYFMPKNFTELTTTTKLIKFERLFSKPEMKFHYNPQISESTYKLIGYN